MRKERSFANGLANRSNRPVAVFQHLFIDGCLRAVSGRSLASQRNLARKPAQSTCSTLDGQVGAEQHPSTLCS